MIPRPRLVVGSAFSRGTWSQMARTQNDMVCITGQACRTIIAAKWGEMRKARFCEVVAAGKERNDPRICFAFLLAMEVRSFSQL